MDWMLLKRVYELYEVDCLTFPRLGHAAERSEGVSPCVLSKI